MSLPQFIATGYFEYTKKEIFLFSNSEVSALWRYPEFRSKTEDNRKLERDKIRGDCVVLEERKAGERVYEIGIGKSSEAGSLRHCFVISFGIR